MATTARRTWELQRDEPRNNENNDETRNNENDDDRNEENDERNAVQTEEPTGIDGVHENAPGDSREPADAATRTIGSVRPRFAVDRVADVFWQEIYREYLKGNLMVSQEDLEYFSEEHPIAKAWAERDSNPFDPQVQAMLAASQGVSDGIDPSTVIAPQGDNEGESPVNVRRQQPVHESPISIQRAQTTPESPSIVTRAATQAEPATPVAGGSSGPGGSDPLEIWCPCSKCPAVLTSASSLRFHLMTKHRFQATTAPVPVNGDQNEAAATGSQETEVVTLSSDDQDSNVGRSPTERTEIASP